MSAETNFETAVRAALETYDESLPLAPQQRRTDEPGDVTRVTVLNMAGFASRMAGLSRRALRLGLPEIVWRVVSKQRDTIRRYLIDDFGHRTLAGTESVETTTVEVACPWSAVRLPGWQFVAKLTPFESGNIVTGTPAHECPAKYRTAEIECEHCGTNRRRNDSFVLLSDSGAYTQVGRSCLGDFIGHDSAGRAANQFLFCAEVSTILRDWSDGDGGFWDGDGAETIAAYDCALAIAKGLTVDGGRYVSKAKAAQESDFTLSTGEKVRTEWKDIKVDEAVMERAHCIIASLLESLPTAESTTYEYNLRLLLTAGYCTPKTLGIAVSSIAAYNRSQTLKVEREKASESTHVGSIGYRIRVSGVLMRTWNTQSDWGVTTKCAVVSDTGSIMIVNNLTCDIGDRVEFTGTVSRHDDYRGTSQTVFTRPAKVTVTKPTDQ